MRSPPPNNIGKLNQNAKGDSKLIDDLNLQVRLYLLQDDKQLFLNLFFLFSRQVVFCRINYFQDFPSTLINTLSEAFVIYKYVFSGQ